MRRIDLFILVVVILLLTALLVPAIQQAREAARRTVCRNHLKSLGLSLLNYYDAYQNFPYGCIGNPELPAENRWSWYPNILPFHQQAAIPPINFMSNSRDSGNWPLSFEVEKSETFTVTLRPPMGITCPNSPSDVGEHQQEFASYVGITGIGSESPTIPLSDENAGIWGHNRCVSFEHIKKKTENTILLIETAMDCNVWLYGGRPTTRWAEKNQKQLGQGRNFGGLHEEVVIAGMADGSVKILSENITPSLFNKMTTIGPNDE